MTFRSGALSEDSSDEELGEEAEERVHLAAALGHCSVTQRAVACSVQETFEVGRFGRFSATRDVAMMLCRASCESLFSRRATHASVTLSRRVGTLFQAEKSLSLFSRLSD